MLTSPLTFMFSAINNASFCHQMDVSVPTNKKCLQVLELLYREGFIRGYTYNQKRTLIYIKFTGSVSRPVIQSIQPISTNSRKIYVNFKILTKLMNTNEFLVVSTPKGLFTLKEALQRRTAGLLLCKII